MRCKFDILLSVAVPARYDGVYRDILMDGFVPPSSSVAPMFPFYEKYSEWDDFGEVINPDDYVIKEEDMDHGSMQVGGDPNGRFDTQTFVTFNFTP
ncbi:hypothetical protein Vadar_013133 [Vaccinium darrowii]|uniref:Uncharacterized protein n=1 Tax=Vaccinium darrowii TaxID=229202 RepID=A0ACB7YNH5_9ERIC|nr:hypothetical protein Vadar_013133 [Vaccinium darrowii]